MSKRGQKILRKYGIDPVIGIENLVWAPNATGQHVTANLKKVVDASEWVDKKYDSYEAIAAILKKYGKIASKRR